MRCFKLEHGEAVFVRPVQPALDNFAWSSSLLATEVSGAVAAEGDAAPGAKKAEEQPAVSEEPSTEAKPKKSFLSKLLHRKPSMADKEVSYTTEVQVPDA